LTLSESLIVSDAAPVFISKICNVCQGDFGRDQFCQNCGSNWCRTIDERKRLTRLTLRLKHNDGHLLSDADPFKKMSRKTKRSLKKLQEYQMNPAILVRLRRKFPFDQMSNHEINVCISEFKKFMAILAIGRTEKKKVAMTSEIVDQVWHEFILFTKDYIEFSFAVRGDYIHHSPNTGDDKFGPDAARYFYESYAKYFGKLHPVWKLKIRESKVRYDPKTNTYCSSVSNPVDKSPIASHALIKNGYPAQPTIFFGNSGDGGNSSYPDGQDSNSVDNAGVYGDNGSSNLADGSNPSSFTRYEITNKDMSSSTSCGGAFDSGCGGSCGADSDGSDGGGGNGGDGCSGCGGCGGCG